MFTLSLIVSVDLPIIAVTSDLNVAQNYAVCQIFTHISHDVLPIFTVKSTIVPDLEAVQLMNNP
jgi:hypothetical protein